MLRYFQNLIIYEISLNSSTSLKLCYKFLNPGSSQQIVGMTFQQIPQLSSFWRHLILSFPHHTPSFGVQ